MTQFNSQKKSLQVTYSLKKNFYFQMFKLISIFSKTKQLLGFTNKQCWGGGVYK